jgi:Na+-transporting NADH:ubiquinone oxidoreductase subunit A
MSKVIKIKKGLDIHLKGVADRKIAGSGQPGLVAVKPADFKGIEPKLLVKPGHEVLTGTPLFYHKAHPEIVFVSPVAGTVEAVNRGERRKLLEVVVRAGSTPGYEPLEKGSPASMDREAVLKQILASGLWPAIIQRPYGVLANPEDTPRDIYISSFDTAPLAPDYEFILQDGKEAFRTGVAALSRLTSGKVHIGLDAKNGNSPVFAGIEGVEYHLFSGPHPCGTPGVQLHHVAPVNKGEVVWTINPQSVALIGRTFLLGYLDSTWTFALAGSLVREPRYVKGTLGMAIAPIIEGQLAEGELPPRLISGNVLTGTRIERDGYLCFSDSLLSVIPEGKHFELLGWAALGAKKFSASHSFLSSLIPRKSWDLDTNLNGGQRAFVMTGQYEKVFPMDILPVQLLKAALVSDIDKMEQLGIYEVIEEDMALCEFVCTSKIDVQEILRNGLDLIRKELS